MIFEYNKDSCDTAPLQADDVTVIVDKTKLIIVLLGEQKMIFFSRRYTPT